MLYKGDVFPTWQSLPKQFSAVIEVGDAILSSDAKFFCCSCSIYSFIAATTWHTLI